MRRIKGALRGRLFCCLLRVLLCLWIFLVFVPIAHSESSKLKKVNTQSEGFVLKKVGNHYEPELFAYPIALPDSNIKVGAYRYSSRLGYDISKLGFLIDNDKFYFVQGDEYSECGDANYGVFSGYFVIDGWGYGSTSGHSRLMFLFKYDRNSVQLLDVVGQTNVASYVIDFMTETRQEQRRGYLTPLVIDINDIDGNGKPEIKIQTFGNYYEPYFELYFEIVNNKLHVNLNSELYKPLFKSMQNKYKGKAKPVSYFIYGYLSNKLELKEVMNMLPRDKDNYKFVINLLQNVDKWDAAFHDRSGEKFELIQYNLDRR